MDRDAGKELILPETLEYEPRMPTSRINATSVRKMQKLPTSPIISQRTLTPEVPEAAGLGKGSVTISIVSRWLVKAAKVKVRSEIR